MSASGGAKRASFLELFFDLVFVFAVTQLAAMLHADHSAAGWGRAGLMAWLVWWAWSQYTWAGNAIDTDRRPVRAAVLTVTALTVVMAAAMPEAYGEDGAWFAVPYALVRGAGLALYFFGVRHDAGYRAALRAYLPLASIPPAAVLAGGLVAPAARGWIWLAAVALDVASALAAGRGEFRVAADHFAERHGLIFIIALGESIIAVGATVAQFGLDLTGAATVGLALALIAGLWWSYFDSYQAAAEEALARTADLRRRGRLARDVFTFAHFPVVAGIVVFAAGVEEAVQAPGDPFAPFGLTAVSAGIAAVLLGLGAAHLRATGRLLVERALAAAAVVALALGPGSRVSALTLLCALAGVLGLALAVEAARRRLGTRTGSAAVTKAWQP